MPQVNARMNRGYSGRRGKSPGKGYLLTSRNCRYLVGDQDRVWALLGRSKFNAVEIPDAAVQGADEDVKAVFGYYAAAGGARPPAATRGDNKLVVHKGGTFFEADLDLTGTFSEVFHILDAGAPAALPCAYRDSLYYCMGTIAVSTEKFFSVRGPLGWSAGGFRVADVGGSKFTAAAQGSGSFGSTTDVKYLIRLYDSTIDGTGSPGSFAINEVTVTAPGVLLASIRLTFASGITASARGTHLRIYRTLLNEEPGLYYRVDGAGDGIALASVTPGYTWDDTTDNTTSQIYGRVRADGQEGTNAWAEHGGAPLGGTGAVMFNDHLVVWGITGSPFSSRIYYSARGYPELFPRDSSGTAPYYLQMSSSQQGIVLRCVVVGSYLLAMMESAIFRVTHLPTYDQPGFDRVVQDMLEDEHGIVGQWAADTFGIGEDESQYCIYVSTEHGPMLTNGVFTRPIIQHVDWSTIVEREYQEATVVKNYPSFQETWIFFTPLGGTENTQALIIDYSMFRYGTMRVTYPVDVKATNAAYCLTNEGDPYLFLSNTSEKTIYVQDSGDTDTQENYNASGHIPWEVETQGEKPRGLNKATRITRAMLDGQSGTSKTLTVEHLALTGKDEYSENDTVEIGAGETVDSFLVNMTGQRHRTKFTYAGTTGANYIEGDADCAPCLKVVEYDAQSGGRQGRTKGTS